MEWQFAVGFLLAFFLVSTGFGRVQMRFSWKGAFIYGAATTAAFAAGLVIYAVFWAS